MTTVKIIKTLKRKGFPIDKKAYPEAHAEADIAEKRKFPRGYARLKKAQKRMAKDELMGKNTRSGKIEVERKYKRNKNEIAYHEHEEHLALKRLAKKTKKK